MFDRSLLKSEPGMISNFVLELTERCNLRCVYCHQNIKGFTPQDDITEDKMVRVMENLRDVKPPFINLTGGGDIIMFPDWHKQCAKILSYGIPVRATMNMSKMLTNDEADVLAKFSLITVSLDTVDRDALRLYRKSVDVRTISYNILMVNTAAKRLDIPGPDWIISAVYYAEIAGGLEDVALYAASVGARWWGLQDLSEYSGIDDNVTPVWQLRGEKAVQVANDTQKAIATAQRLGLSLSLPGDFVERLEAFKKDAYVAAA